MFPFELLHGCCLHFNDELIYTSKFLSTDTQNNLKAPFWCVYRYRDFKTCLHSIKELRAKDPDQTKLAEYGKQAAGSLMQVTRFIPCAMTLSIHNIFSSSPPHAHIQSCCIWCIILHMYSQMSNMIYWHHCVYLGTIFSVEVTHVLHMVSSCAAFETPSYPTEILATTSAGCGMMFITCQH